MRTWYSAIVLALREVGGRRVHLQEIYEAVGHHRPLSEHDLEPHPRHAQQNFKHTVRSCLVTLQKYGLVEYFGKAIYSLAPLAVENIHVFETDSSGKSGGASDIDISELLARLKPSRTGEGRVD